MRQLAHRAPRRALKIALTLGAAGLASLAFAGVASANVIVVQPDNNTGTDHLTAAITTANTNTATSNTIVLEPGTYQPATEPITISKNLTITSDHTLQQPSGTGLAAEADIQGAAAAAKAANNLFNVNGGVTFRLDAIGCDACGGSGFGAIDDNGNLVMNNDEFIGGQGYGLKIETTGTATLTDTSLENIPVNDIVMAGGSTANTVTLNNVSIDQGLGSAVLIDAAPYTLNMTNTLMAFQTNAECAGAITVGAAVTNGGPGSLDDDGTCGVQYSNQSGIDGDYPINQLGNGGPTESTQLPAGNTFTALKGVSPCPIVDQAFFPNPVNAVTHVTECDVGAMTISQGTQDTTPPSCTVTSTNEGTTPATQTVALSDTTVGIGPQPLSSATDNESGVPETTYPPPAFATVPSYAVSNEQINNGTVAFTPFTADSLSPLVLTASKTTAGSTTQWSFTGTNWAGDAKNCF